MKRFFVVAAALALLCLCVAVQADVFNLGSGFANLETVTVSDAGNVGELSGYGSQDPRVCGSVGYNYNVGKYEVTAKQYTDFLNAKAKTDTYGLYNTNMDTANNSYGCNIKRTGTSGNYTYSVASDWANRPVNWVSFWDACRFANWLGNGQGDGDTETGAYDLGGYNGDGGTAIQRSAGWKWAVTSEDEWYKAAYYKGSGTNAGYWLHATRSNNYPSNVGSDGYADPGNHANFLGAMYNDHLGPTIGSPYFRTNVGEFENSASAYGTFDQLGNVWEWNEAIIGVNGYDGQYRSYRGLRGGSFANDDDGYTLIGTTRYDYYINSTPPYEGYNVGFRVSEAVPEPSSIIAFAGGLVAFLGVRRRRP